MQKKQATALLSIALCAPVFASGTTEDDALNLADATTESATIEASNWRIFTEATAGRTTVHQWGQPDRAEDTQRLSLDLLIDKKLSPELRAVLSDRLDLNHQSEALGQKTLNNLKEAYLSWQPQNDRVLDAGRINVRYGAATGYNPTDFFREGANRAITSFDPNAIRENRMGTAMLRGQTLWQGGALTAIVAPKVSDKPNNGDWSADFGSTNNRNRWLVSVSHQLADNFNPQLVLYGDQRQPVQMGLNLAMLVNDATVAHMEWSGGQQKTLLAQALPLSPAVAQDETFRNRLATGLTYTTTNKLSITGEYHYNGAAVDKAVWNALRTSSMLDYASYRELIEEQLDLTTRQAAFVRASWQDAFINRLDLTAVLRYNLDDHSKLSWLEARYRFDKSEIALQWLMASGNDSSDFGAMAQRRYIQALFRHYF
ncbi:hypothetical protein [Rhodoferax sp. U11-2br]|uniref:hypothetical protein n=1 Tax=Rhodoferax sp. U11-2br TaxID=2838878 RepID=UPI001BE5E458|nr:hypothetical protein [Rhodoferax sp. U11-2br]MBT3067066.1 hypothetical protein [Rhodoferax sp. U11-2br]